MGWGVGTGLEPGKWESVMRISIENGSGSETPG